MRNLKWIIVTGPTSGIGRAVALEMLCRGHSVILAARNTTNAEFVSREAINKNYPGTASVHKVDMCDMTSIAKLVASLASEEITLEGIINNAGVCRTKFSLSPGGIEETLATNTIGPYALSLWCLKDNLFPEVGKIINIATHILPAKLDREWILGKAPFSMRKSYMQSKIALLLLSEHLSENACNDTCQILSIFPGIVRSKLGRESLPSKIFGMMFDPFISPPELAAEVICNLYESKSPQNGMVFHKTKETSYRYIGDKKSDTDWLAEHMRKYINSLVDA